MRPRDGFTLIELLIVTVIIGILAAVAAPRLHRIRVQSHVGALRTDLRNLATAEEMHRVINGQYAALSALGGFRLTEGVAIDFRWLQADAYAARATHAAAPGWECWYVSGRVPPGHVRPVGADAQGVQCIHP